MIKNRSTRLAWLLAYLPLMLTFVTVSTPLSAVESGAEAPPLEPVSVPAIALRAASGSTIPFVTQNGKTIGGIRPQTLELPHLVLYRNGVLSDSVERTLILEVAGIEVPPSGVTVTLTVETEHGDPDPGKRAGQRIPVWQATRRIAGITQGTQTNVTVPFVHEFSDIAASELGTVATPTDYFGVEVRVTDAAHPTADPLYGFSEGHAFLLESQWVARLPEVSEDTAGAAPDELIVYYCDMFPFRKGPHEPTTWLPRDRVTNYVGAELVPQMVEAFRVPTDEWGFVWYDEWTGYRSEDTERLSVALTDERTWFHGSAPSGGHSGISIRVKGGNNAPFDTLTDGIVSTFHHELFHNLQRGISLHSGGDGRVGGAENAWKFFSEGTAVLAESAGQPRGQFTQTLPARTYMSYANGYIWRGGGRARGLNVDYGEMDPYQAAVYWRFLYEQCSGMAEGVENPAAGMQVIRGALTALYSGEVVDIRSSTDLVGALAAIMDQAIAGSSCSFQTYEESLRAFSRALYGLRLQGGSCIEPGTPAGCGPYDPYHQYREPPLSTIVYTGTDRTYRDQIGSSFGIDMIDVVLDPAADGQPLTIEIRGAPGSEATLNVELVPLVDSEDRTDPRPMAVERDAFEIHARVDPDGSQIYVIPAIRTTDRSRLGLIVTRLDAREALDPVGAYTIVLHPGIDHTSDVRTDATAGK